MQYRVTWGDESRIVNAADEAEAWSAFCDLCEAAQKHPKANERKVELLPEPEPAPESEDVEVVEPEEVETPAEEVAETPEQ